MRILAVLFVLALAVMPAHATYVYNAHDGYWYYGSYGGQAYSRWYQPGYYSYGYYYPGYYYYVPYYPPTTTQTNVTVNVPAPADPNWRAKLLDVVKGRDDNRAYQDALNALGITGPAPGYVGHGMYGGYNGYSNSLHVGSYGVNGNTIYGYNQQALQALYGSADPTLLYQQASRLAERAQDLAGQATGGFQELVAADSEGKNKVAQTIARGLAAAAALQGAQGTGSSVTQTQTQSGTTREMPPAGPIPPAAQTVSQARQGIVNLKCLSCHNPSRKEGGLDLSVYDALPPQEKQVVFDRLVSSDPAKAMPRRPDKSAPRAEDRLNQAELRLFLQ